MGARGPQRTPIDHGTAAGYKKHIKRNDPPCNECKDANSAASRSYKKGNSPGAIRDRARQRALGKAMVRLRNMFPIEFEAFYQDEKKKEPDLNGEG